MKCPNDSADLVQAKRDGIDVESCPRCNGMWFSGQELNQLEDEAFRLGDEEKGSLVASPRATDRKCPQCGKPMQSFDYRFYDLELDFCEDGHGYWLDAGEDKRVLDLMKGEQARLKRTGRAEQTWAAHLQHLRSHSIIEKVRDLFR
ncbi:MAG TPA: zf-TFIIB domain-containing protein [Caulobacteraceae bacterium]